MNLKRWGPPIKYLEVHSVTSQTSQEAALRALSSAEQALRKVHGNNLPPFKLLDSTQIANQ